MSPDLDLIWCQVVKVAATIALYVAYNLEDVSHNFRRTPTNTHLVRPNLDLGLAFFHSFSFPYTEDA